MSSTSSRTRNDAMHKRQKNEEAPAPSKVIHIKNVPTTASESEVIGLVSSFGTVVNTLLIAHKRQAFVQMSDVSAATAAINHYSSQQGFIQGQPVYLQYSTRSEVTIRASNNSGSTSSIISASSGSMSSMEEKKSALPSNETPSTILLVSILNGRLPVSIENLYQVFSLCGGNVLRIVTFQKQTQQALVEYSRVGDAITARRQLDGKDIFQGCCTLKITFSNMTPPLKVRANDAKSRDFSLATSQQSGHFFGYGGSAMGQSGGLAPHALATTHGCVILVNGLVEDKITPDILFTLFGVYGDVQRVKILYNKKSTAFVQMNTPQQAALALQHLNGVELFGSNLVLAPSKYAEVSIPPQTAKTDESLPLTKDYTGSKLHRFRLPDSKNSRHICPPAPVLHISNLPDNTTEDELKEIFATGLEEKDAAAVTVTIFDKARKMAYVSFPNVPLSVHALIRTHNHHLREKYLRVTFSHIRDPTKRAAAIATAAAAGQSGSASAVTSASTSAVVSSPAQATSTSRPQDNMDQA